MKMKELYIICYRRGNERSDTFFDDHDRHPSLDTIEEMLQKGIGVGPNAVNLTSIARGSGFPATKGRHSEAVII